jgi:predicted cobalt transporter CbtA
MHGATGGGQVRAVIAAAVAAGVPAGLVYAAAAYAIAMPVLLEAEVFETGVHAGHAAHAVHVAVAGAGAGRLLWGLAGAVGMACGLALVLTPLVRAIDQAKPDAAPGWRTGAAVGALAFVAVFLLPALVTLPGPPGVEHGPPLGMRQGAWVLSLLLFAAACGAGAWARAVLLRSGRGPREAVLGAAVVGLLVWFAGVGLFLVTTGFDPAPAAGPVPDAVVVRFAAATAVCNALLYAALGAFIPPALRRFGP